MGFENVKGKSTTLNDSRESVRGFRKARLGPGGTHPRPRLDSGDL